jgi:hypothetical protein
MENLTPIMMGSKEITKKIQSSSNKILEENKTLITG